MKGFTRNNKFVPMTDYKKVTRKSRDTETKGIKIENKTRKQREQDIDFTESDKLTALDLIERKPDTTADHLSESTDIGGLDNEDAILEIDRILNILLKEGKITVDNPNAEFPKYRITARGSKQKEIQRLQEKAMAIGKQRVDSMISGTPEETKALWEKEKQAHIELASLEGRTLREGFAES